MFGFAATIVFAFDFYITFNDLVVFLKQGSSDAPEGHKTEGGWNSLLLTRAAVWDFPLPSSLCKEQELLLSKSSFYSWVCLPQLCSVRKLQMEFQWFMKITCKPGMWSFSVSQLWKAPNPVIEITMQHRVAFPVKMSCCKNKQTRTFFFFFFFVTAIQMKAEYITSFSSAASPSVRGA